jgi:hypothetical protein
MLSNKHIFWQALIIALIIFWSGIMVGVFFENARANKLESFYFNAETDIFDLQLEGEILEMNGFDCDFSLRKNIEFADKIYQDAKELEKYDASAKITKDILYLHKRYDLLRVMLWKNVITLQEKCPNSVNSVIYLYEYDDPSTNKQAKQVALSRTLLDLKEKHGDKIILIPIADDTGVSSLDLLKSFYNLDASPVVIINQKQVIEDLKTLTEFEQYLQLY